jgi:hypothetical protein
MRGMAGHPDPQASDTAADDTIAALVASWMLRSARLIRRHPRLLLFLLLDVLLLLVPLLVILAVTRRLSSITSWSAWSGPIPWLGIYSGALLGSWARRLTAAQRTFGEEPAGCEERQPEQPGS